MSVVENVYYSAVNHGGFTLGDIGDLVLEDGATLRGCQLAYQTLGQLNGARDNVVLIPSWYSGTHAVMRDVYVGPGRAIDPADHFVVLVNQIGSGLGTSPHNVDGPYARARFPHVRIGDDVVAQERLLREVLGVEEIALVIGASMGAQQAYEWAVRFPDRVRRAAPIAGTARTFDHDRIWVQTLIDTMRCDPAYADGWYKQSSDMSAALRRHAGLIALHFLSNDFWTACRWRTLGFSSSEDFIIGFLEAAFRPMDAGDLLLQAWKWQHADVSRHAGGDLAAALATVTAKTFVMPISSDKVFPPEDCAADHALLPDSELRVIEDVYGHVSLFGVNPSFSEQLDAALTDLWAAV